MAGKHKSLKGMCLKGQECHEGRLAGQLPSGLKGDTYLGELIIVQDHKLDFKSINKEPMCWRVAK